MSGFPGMAAMLTVAVLTARSRHRSTSIGSTVDAPRRARRSAATADHDRRRRTRSVDRTGRRRPRRRRDAGRVGGCSRVGCRPTRRRQASATLVERANPHGRRDDSPGRRGRRWATVRRRAVLAAPAPPVGGPIGRRRSSVARSGLGRPPVAHRPTAIARSAWVDPLSRCRRLRCRRGRRARRCVVGCLRRRTSSTVRIVVVAAGEHRDARRRAHGDRDPDGRGDAAADGGARRAIADGGATSVGWCRRAASDRSARRRWRRRTRPRRSDRRRTCRQADRRLGPDRRLDLGEPCRRSAIDARGRRSTVDARRRRRARRRGIGARSSVGRVGSSFMGLGWTFVGGGARGSRARRPSTPDRGRCGS